MTKTEIATFYGCSIEQVNAQYAANAKVLYSMYEKALRTGKKVGNYTAEQLLTNAKKYEQLSKSS